jgi:hypothetical protein
MRSSKATMSSPVDWRRAANKVSALLIQQCYMNGGKAKTSPINNRGGARKRDVSFRSEVEVRLRRKPSFVRA